MKNLFRRYRSLEKHILLVIAAEFFIQLINASFLLVLNIYMAEEGYADYRIADFVSYRFLGVLTLAFPLGLFIRGKKLKPVFYLAGFGAPAAGLITVTAVHLHWDLLLYSSLALWGISFTCISVTALPFILRNANKETRSEAISLNYATWSTATIVSGALIYFLSGINPGFFNERAVLTIFSICGFAAAWLIWKIDIPENVPETKTRTADLSGYDWDLILKALIPAIIIAIGAGLTIPFMNLFFYTVHGMDSGTYSLLGSSACVLVLFCALIIPLIRRKYGYRIAITLFQSFGVLALVMLAGTAFYSHWNAAVYLAAFFFLIRQPLMNMAGPMTSELVMDYAGKRNQEMVSALTAAVWSGSWYMSSRIFMKLRQSHISYGWILLITAGIYVIGVAWYHLLILEHERKEKPGAETKIADSIQ